MQIEDWGLKRIIVFRAAAIQAGLPNQAVQHQWPVPGFPMDETATIWWGRDDLRLHNPT